MPRFTDIGLAPGGDVAQAFTNHRPREHGGGGGAVTGDVVGLLGDFFDQFGADALERILEIDLLGDRDAVVRDRGSAPLLLEHHVAALRAEGDAHGVGELVHARFEATAGLLIELNGLGHHSSGKRVVGTLVPRLLIQPGGEAISQPRRPSRAVSAAGDRRNDAEGLARPGPGCRDRRGTARRRRSRTR